jgi:hypothetical protein
MILRVISFNLFREAMGILRFTLHAIRFTPQIALIFPQHFLNFLPLPHGQGSFGFTRGASR